MSEVQPQHEPPDSHTAAFGVSSSFLRCQAKWGLRWMDQNNLYPAKTIWENKTPSGTASAAGGMQFAQFSIK